MLIRIRHEERGAAMVVAVLVSFVVLLLSVFVVQMSIHNTNQSAYDRRRVTAVSAAEAGINAMWSTLQRTRPENLPCGSAATGTVSSTPASTYSVALTYYNSSGAQLTCPLSQSGTQPSSVLLTSTGTTTGVSRKMQSFANLTPINGGLGAAIISSATTAFGNQFTINGNQGTDADVYVTNGDATINQQITINGSVYVPNGSLTMGNSSLVVGDAWANGFIQINSPARITGSAKSSTSSISPTGPTGGTIGGNATAGTTISNAVTVSGSKYPNTVSGPPPTQVFPLVCWTTSGSCTGQQASWTSAGYTFVQYVTGTSSDCTNAMNYLTGSPAANVVLRIGAVCNLSVPNSATVNLPGNLAIFTDGSITLNQLNNWKNTSSATNNLYFIANYRSGLNCATGSYNITTSNNSNFGSPTVAGSGQLNVSFYSPCTVTIANQNQFSGQVIGNPVAITNQATINYTPVLIPGTGSIVGYNQSILYVREVR